MANFNSISEWKKHLEESVIKSLQETANEIYEDWRYRIRGEIYSYNPKTYEKTGMLLDSIRISDVKKQGSLYYIEIYVVDEEHGYTEQWKDEIHTYPKIFDMFNEGFHNNTEINPSSEIKQIWIEARKWVDLLKTMLKEKGFNV